MAVAGVVILYHPDDNVIQNIQSYLPFIDKLYVAENTEGQMSKLAAQLWNTDKIQVLYDGNNEGIAKRLNEAAAMAIGEEYNWLLTMDQDSCFEGSVMQDYLLCAGGYMQKSRVAVFGAEHEVKARTTESCMPVELNKLITSGSIINLQLFAETGGFTEQLFIDEVDFDYCYRARMKNFQIVKFSNIFLTHSLGTSSQHRSLKNMQVTNRALHSPKRMYYMARNFLYVNKHFKKHFPQDIETSRKGLLNRIKNNLLYNRKRANVLVSIVKGFIDYKLNRF